jgi:hypothetical protein
MFAPIKRRVARQFDKCTSKNKSNVLTKPSLEEDGNDSFTSHTTACSSDSSPASDEITNGQRCARSSPAILSEGPVREARKGKSGKAMKSRNGEIGSKCRRSSMRQSGSSLRASISSRGEFEFAMPNTSEKVSRRTCVYFNEKVKIKEVPPVWSLVENPERLWFQDKDFQKIQTTCWNLAEMAESGLIEEGKDICLRGLELMTVLESNKATVHRLDACDAVLDEQDAQVVRRSFDEKAIANSYRLATIASRFEAEKRAKKDENDVKSYLKSARQTANRLPRRSVAGG